MTSLRQFDVIMALYLRHVSVGFGRAGWDDEKKARRNEKNIFDRYWFHSIAVLPTILYFKNSTKMGKSQFLYSTNSLDLIVTLLFKHFPRYWRMIGYFIVEKEKNIRIYFNCLAIIFEQQGCCCWHSCNWSSQNFFSCPPIVQ